MFISNFAWKAWVHSAAEISKTITNVLLRFFYSKGGQYVPVAIEAFSAKIMSQVLFWAGIWRKGISESLSYTLFQFLH